MDVLIENPRGNFRFVRGIGPYSSGAVASPGYEVVHAIFKPLPSLWEGLSLVKEHLGLLNRPLHALCGIELRIPRALSFEDFREFNQPYIEKLKAWNLEVDGLNPVARTNVALEINPVPEPSVYGFFYTIPSNIPGKTFASAGAGELRSDKLSASEIVRYGDTSTDGLREKVERVLEIMTQRLNLMNLEWSDVTAVNVYTIYDIHPILGTTLLPASGDAGRHEIRWNYARPPITGIDFEMDLRGIRQEIVLSG